MALNDRKNGGMFKCRGSGNSGATAYTYGYTGNPGNSGGGLDTRVIRYAYDQLNLLQRYYNYHIPSGLEEVSYNLDQYSNTSVSADRKTISLQLDIEQADYDPSDTGYYYTNHVFFQVVELVDAEDIVMQGILDRNVEDVRLIVSTSNAGSYTLDGNIQDYIFNYNSKWYLAVPRETFKSISAFQTTVTLTLTVDSEVYMTGTLSEYISIKNTGGNTELGDFDFAVIRYLWTDSAGEDLDTRTRITTPPRNVDVGWSRSDTDSSYLRWGGDNRGSGVEAVLIDIKALIAQYPDIVEFIIELRAFWYSSVQSGVVGLEFVSYKGGSMSASGYDFVNSGGVVVQSLNLTNTTFVNQSDDIDGEHLATIFFNPETKMGMFSLEDTAPKPILEPARFSSLTQTTLGSGRVRISFNNPTNNSSLGNRLTVYRRTTPFTSTVPSSDDAYELVENLVVGSNSYEFTGTQGTTYYFMLAITDVNYNILNPAASITVAIPNATGYIADKIGLTLRLNEARTKIIGDIVNTANNVANGYYNFGVWYNYNGAMHRLSDAGGSFYTSNNPLSWDMDLFNNPVAGNTYGFAIAIVNPSVSTTIPLSDPTFANITISEPYPPVTDIEVFVEDV